MYYPGMSDTPVENPHAWVVEEIDGGHLGVDDCWYCTTCGCSGGGTRAWDMKKWPKPGPNGERAVIKSHDRKPTPFLPGPAMNLPHDCLEAKRAIAAYKATQAYQERRVEDLRHYGGWILADLKGFGVTGSVQDDGYVQGGLAVGDGAIRVLECPFGLEPLPDDPEWARPKGWILRLPATGQQVTEETVGDYNVAIQRLRYYYANAALPLSEKQP